MFICGMGTIGAVRIQDATFLDDVASLTSQTGVGGMGCVDDVGLVR